MKNKRTSKKSNGKASKKKGKALLLGLGLDSKDEHVRITKGDNFRLVGGTKDTHECMQEKAIKFNEELKKRGKQLEQVDPKEFIEIAERVKLNEKG